MRYVNNILHKKPFYSFITIFIQKKWTIFNNICNQEDCATPGKGQVDCPRVQNTIQFKKARTLSLQ